MSGMFVGFYVYPYDDDKRIPISTGRTRDEAMEKAIRRVLITGMVNGSVAVVKQDEMDEDTFSKINAFLDTWFAKVGDGNENG